LINRRKPESLLPTAGKMYLEGYIVYTSTKQWWRHLFGDYSHCSLVMRKGKDWVWFEPSSGFSEVQVWPVGLKWVDFFPEATRIQKFSVWREPKAVRCSHLVQPFTCVEQIKAFLGTTNPFILTPKQLCRSIDHGRHI